MFKWWDVLLSVAVVAVGLLSCRSTSPPPCMVPVGHVIRWGVWNDTTGMLSGYQLRWDGQLVRYSQHRDSPAVYIFDTLSIQIPRQTHCDIALSLRNAFLREQTYVVIGPLSHYVEYNTPTATLRAVWDARFETYGSRHFRGIFRWLNSLVGHHESPHR
ncbi:MAG: hypothetical protein RMK00_03955 [Bacteroidota bacterium]|nr:hypothetical protein [Chlorobiota bacterium]MDW8074911.1 hypothetical protein [Bacteroidota bacterium]